MTDLKVLFFDIETAPLLAYIWSPWDGFVTHDRLIHDCFLLTWAAKWAGQKKVMTDSLTSEEAVAQDDSRIAASLADLIREADIVVAHNGDRFDIPKLNGRLLQMNLEPLGPVQTIDTLKLAKRHLNIAFRKLDYLGEFLGVGKKIKTDFELWRQSYYGNETALRKMTRYNRQDVILLERVFDRMKPYVQRLTRLHEGSGCPYCGSDNTIRRGYHRTQASTFPQFQCRACGKYHRGKKAEFRAEVHPL